MKIYIPPCYELIPTLSLRQYTTVLLVELSPCYILNGQSVVFISHPRRPTLIELAQVVHAYGLIDHKLHLQEEAEPCIPSVGDCVEKSRN